MGSYVEPECMKLDLPRDIPQIIVMSFYKNFSRRSFRTNIQLFHIIPISQKNKPVIGGKKAVHFVNHDSCRNILVDKLHVEHAIVSLITVHVRQVCFV